MAEVCPSWRARNTSSEWYPRWPTSLKHSRRNRLRYSDVSFPGHTVLERERCRQDTINAIKKKFGKNSLLKAMDLLPPKQRHAVEKCSDWGHRSGRNQWSLNRFQQKLAKRTCCSADALRTNTLASSWANRAKYSLPLMRWRVYEKPWQKEIRCFSTI